MSFTRSSDIDSSWQYISQGVDVLMKRDLASLGLTTEVYMNMYTAIHNFCVSTHPVSSRQYASSGRGHHTKLLGGELYARLVDYLKAHLADLLARAPQPTPTQNQEVFEDLLLDYYNRSWTRFLVGARYLDHIFSYLNRHWVKQERDEGGRKRGFYEVHTLCLVLWRDCMFVPLEPVLVPVLLAAIRRDRDGRLMDYAALHTCVQSMVAVGFDDLNSRRTNLLFYAEHFQRAFIADTAAYYTAEADRVLAERGVVSYMQRVLDRLAEERLRVQRYLHASTEDVLMAECEQVLIQGHVQAIQQVFGDLLVADNRSVLRTMFVLLRKVPHGLDPIRANLELFVTEAGMTRINELGDTVDPRQYVDALLEVARHFDTLLSTAFESWPPMKEAIDRGFTVVVNSNRIARPAQGGDSRTPELLSRYTDNLLKKSTRADGEEVERGVEGVLKLLQFTEEKDVFERHYQRLLSRRLVLQSSASPEIEQRMVKRLGDICGFEYTNKLQRMFQDVSTSQKLQEQFRAGTPATPNRNSFQPFVLAKGFWPLPARDVPLELPPALRAPFDEFVEFYDRVHNGRKLKWLWNFGKGEMKLNLPNGKVVVLSVSIYQMMILLAFNNADVLTHDQLATDVRLPAELLDGSLAYIVKSGILVEQAPNVYAFNPDFKSKRLRINLNLPLKTESVQDGSESEKQLEEQRQGFLQAIIVRIMKTRKHLGHAQLVEEVMQQALVRFRPSVKDVKRALTSLLEREYLRRAGNDEYEYAA